ncbi:MAG: hypothetical protein LBO71_06345 [Prevotellaceae bacterium]|jgi:hypothetical protein|nr:hypothetical protein [Prevotellaceae bacterium]
MKYCYTFMLACLFLLNGCVNLPEPELPEESSAVDIVVKIDEVTTSESYIYVKASMSNAYYNGRLADEVGVYVNNVKYGLDIPAKQTNFEYSFYATAAVEYNIRAYAKFGSKIFYSDYRQASFASSIVSECLALSNGLYYYFRPPTNTRAYYFATYAQSELPGSDRAITNDLLANGVEHRIVASNDSYEGYAYDLTASTTYTLCVLRVDVQGKQTLEKRTFTTKSASNQPRAVISISSVLFSGAIDYTTAMLGSCAKYVLIGFYNLSPSDLNLPDIYWAGECYNSYKDDDNIYTIGHYNQRWSGWSGTSVLVSLGFTSTGANGGVISKQFFSITSGSLITKSLAIPAAAAPMQVQQQAPKSADVDQVRKSRVMRVMRVMKD